MKETIAQQRARFAYRQVASWSKSWRSEATNQVKGLPVQVRSQGVGTVVALLRADSKKAASRELALVLADWLLDKCPRCPLGVSLQEGVASTRQLIEACVKADRATWAAANAEAIALLEQLKIFATALDPEQTRD